VLVPIPLDPAQDRRFAEVVTAIKAV